MQTNQHFDNADLHLENVKTGDEVTSVRGDSCHGVWTVGEWSKLHKAFRLLNSKGKSVGILPASGIRYDFMSRKEKPDSFYSANPKHLKKARAAIALANRVREKKEKLAAQKREIYLPLLDSYSDGEDDYTFEFLSTDALQRLSIRQLKVLAKWLK